MLHKAIISDAVIWLVLPTFRQSTQKPGDC